MKLVTLICLLCVGAWILIRWSDPGELKSTSQEVKTTEDIGDTSVALNDDDEVTESRVEEGSATPKTNANDIAITGNKAQPIFREINTVERPLAFYEPSARANWSDEQRQRLKVLRNEFAATLGGWNQNPYDPDYRERWIRAQPLLDEQFETIFGVEAFSEQQIQAAHSSE